MQRAVDQSQLTWATGGDLSANEDNCTILTTFLFIFFSIIVYPFKLDSIWIFFSNHKCGTENFPSTGNTLNDVIYPTQGAHMRSPTAVKHQ